MPLRTRFLIHNLLLVIGLLLIGGIAVWRLLSLRGEVKPVPVVYSELHTVAQVSSEAGRVRGLLSNPAPNRDEAVTHLRYAIGGLDQFMQLGSVYAAASGQASLSASQSVNEAATAARNDLQSALDALASRPQPGDVNASVGHVEDALADLDRLTNSCTQFLGARQETASSHLADNFILLGAFALLAILGAVVLSIMHHRLVVRPLMELREGVKAVAAARFAQKLDLAKVTSGPEFAELSSEFNRMADELDGFYQRLEEQVRVKSRELIRSERLASVGFLAAGVAHEINNPLHIISGYAELMLKQLDRVRTGKPLAADDLVQSAKTIRDEAFRCKEITEKLLSLSRGGKAERETLDLSNLAAEVASMTQGLRDYRDRRVTLRFDPKPLEVQANVTEMKQVLLNLTINALESVEPQRGEVRIEGRRRPDWVELSVDDNGRGMEPDVLRHVFEPFFTARGKERRGTGLGLSITHAIVESHGGRIFAESGGAGRGAKFTVLLPAIGPGAVPQSA